MKMKSTNRLVEIVDKMHNAAKGLAKRFIPQKKRIALRRVLGIESSLDHKFEDSPIIDVFTSVYEKKSWGRSRDRRYFSGSGSNNETIISTYVESVSRFLEDFDQPQLIVDLGCGDFTVGSKLVPFVSRCIAIDIFSGVIEENKELYRSDKVEFRVLDFINDDIPFANIVLVRQVLQHLSNRDILKFVTKISKRCQYLVVTEHLPGKSGFVPNKDKPTGPGFRVPLDSGVILTAPPFSLQVVEARQLCECEEQGGLITTTMYKF